MNSLLSKIKYNKSVVKLYSFFHEKIQHMTMATDVPEVRKLECRTTNNDTKCLRCNLVVPSLQKKHVFGGIATALTFFQEMCLQMGCNSRIIILDAEFDRKCAVSIEGYQLVEWNQDSKVDKQIVDMSCRTKKTLAVSSNDVFMATCWWSAYLVREIIQFQKQAYGICKPLLYFIQDYEPGFYPWSSKYLMAESTYKMDVDVMAVFNTKLLYDYFADKSYKFYKMWYFEPELNKELVKYLKNVKEFPERKKQILIYGRPSTPRNAFELIVESLRQWVEIQQDANEWKVISAGEKFEDVDIGKGLKIHSVGKLSLDEYAKLMLESRIGISLMVSPHPSYPPLEMAMFGMKVITNSFANKDMTQYSDNIVSVEECSATNLAKYLKNICNINNIYNNVNVKYDKKRFTWNETFLTIADEWN